jgi:ABC-type uncharacterized transport system ATPase subunit
MNEFRNLKFTKEKVYSKHDVLQYAETIWNNNESIDDKEASTTTTIKSPIITSCLNHDEIKRYCRQLLVEDGVIDVTGQIKPRNAKVLVVGAGGIGSTVLLYLSGFWDCYDWYH